MWFFWGMIYLLFHTYLIYPLILIYFNKLTPPSSYSEYALDDSLPLLSIIFSAHNEETVLLKKLESLLNTSYPLDRIEILVGSDASTDATNDILHLWSTKHSFIRFYSFAERRGKTSIINELVKHAKGEHLVFTDANILFKKSTLFDLIKKMKDTSVALVAGNIINYNLKKDGISLQEREYTNQENKIKYIEGKLWGATMGAFGGLFAVKKEYYTPLPPTAIVDDFFITLSVIKQKQKAILSLDALAYEDVGNEGYEEFKRKKRIAIGNFQNLNWFKTLLWSKRRGIAFAFFSHKVLRWFGPIFLLLIFVFNLYLLQVHLLYHFTFWGQLLFYCIPAIEYLFRKLNIHFFGFRFVTHFVSMNVALFVGLCSYLFLKRNNTWQPTKRFQ